MKSYHQADPFCIVEDGFNTDKQVESENIFCLGNDYLIQQANMAEFFSGKSTLGSFCKTAQPVDFAALAAWKSEFDTEKPIVINAPDWTSIVVRLNAEVLDLRSWEVLNFRRKLNLNEAMLERSFEAVSPSGQRIVVTIRRFLSFAQKEIAAISYSIKSLNFEGRISFMPVVNGDLVNDGLRCNELEWNVLQTKTQKDVAHIWTKIKKFDFHVCTALCYAFYKNNEQLNTIATKIEKEKVAGFSVGVDVRSGDTVSLNKYVAVLNSTYVSRNNITHEACEMALMAKKKGWNMLFEEHNRVWSEKWGLQLSKMKNSDKSSSSKLLQVFKKNQSYY
jgi:maltose phosphorylase